MNALLNSTAPRPEPLIPETARNVFARLPTVLAMRGGVSTSALYDDMKRGLFPRPVALSRRMVVWPLDEVERINAALIAGADDETIRALVKELVEARKDRA